MLGTVAFCNGVLFQDCTIREFDSYVDRDMSNTDAMYVRTRVTVSSILTGLEPLSFGNEQATGGSVPQYTSQEMRNIQNQGNIYVGRHAFSGNDTLGARLEAIKTLLSEPRKDFWLAVNSQTSFDLVNDDKNNPLAPAAEGNSFDPQKPYRILLVASHVEEIEGALPNDPRYLKQFVKGVDGRGDTIGYPLPDLNTGRAGDGGRIRSIDVADMDNGPKPLGVRVEEIIGGRAAVIVFTIEVCRLIKVDNEIDAVKYALPPRKDASKCEGVISNRWSITESLDDERRTTIELSGTLTVKDRTYKPMAMRLMVQPMMFPYAKCAHRSFFTDPTGLRLDYRYVMRETGPAAPPAIADWNGTFSQTSEQGGVTYANLMLYVKGWVKPPFDNTRGRYITQQEYKQYLIMMCARMAQSRLRLEAHPFGAALDNNAPADQDKKRGANVITTRAIVMERMETNVVQVFLTARINDLDMDVFGLRGNTFGAPFQIDQYDERWWEIPETYPWDAKTANEAFPHVYYGSFYDCYLQDPNSPYHGMPRGMATPSVREREAIYPGGHSQPVTSQKETISIAIQPAMSPLDLVAAAKPYPGQEVGPIDRAFYASSPASGVTENQLRDATYMAWKSLDAYTTDSGVRMAALSGERQVQGQPNADKTIPQYKVSSVPIRLYAPQQSRVVQIIASRLDDIPIIPNDYAVIETGDAANLIQHYQIKREIVFDSSTATDTGQNAVRSVEAKITYGLSRPIVPVHQDIGRNPDAGYGGDAYTIYKDPRVRQMTIQNPKAADITDKGLAINGLGEITSPAGLYAENKQGRPLNLNPDNSGSSGV